MEDRSTEIKHIDTSHPGKILLWATTVLIYGITLFPNYGLTEGLTIFGMNFTSRGGVIKKFTVDIQPASSSNIIWTIVFVWQAAWMIYTSTLIFRQSERGRLYYSPAFMNNYIYGFFIIASIGDFIWNILWGLQYVQYCLLTNLVLIPCLFISLVSSFYGLRYHGQELVNQGKKKDIYCTVLFVQYGIGIYAFQASMSLLINLSSVLSYYGGMSLQTSGAVSLSVLLVEIVLWFMLDNFIYEKFCRYFFIPYFIIIYFLGGSLQHNWKAGAPNSIFTAVLLAITCVCLIIKFVLVRIRSKTQPLFDWSVVHELNTPVRSSEYSPLISGDI